VGAESGWAAVPALLTLASLGATVGSGLSFGHAVAAVAFSGAWLFLHHVADTRGLLTTLTSGSPAVGRAAAVHTSAGWRVEVDLLGDDGVRHRHLLPTHHLEADPALPLRLRSDAQGRPAHVVAPTRLRTVRGDRHGGLHPTAVSYAILIAAALAPWIGLAIGAATP
jgi:hypothetical protein